MVEKWLVLVYGKLEPWVLLDLFAIIGKLSAGFGNVLHYDVSYLILGVVEAVVENITLIFIVSHETTNILTQGFE